MNYIIVCGNPVDGFDYVGPFVDRDEATHYAEVENQRIGTYWWIAELVWPAPEE
jgi:hypothetical protein